MSLFSVCNWWSTQCSDVADNLDSASLLCARFGLTEQEKDYIIVGAHSGQLAIYYPSLEMDGRAGYKPTDLMLELNLHVPIIGVYAGKFSSQAYNENSNQLAILQPYAVTIYNIQTVSGVAEHGTQLRLQQLAEHKFERMAYSFCKGHFGQVKGREFFCVVHLNGHLTFFEQDGINYECQFPGQRALPAPVAYCERTDSFFRLNAMWHLECFTYQDLSHSSINKGYFTPIWSVCLGEGVVDMCVVQSKADSSSIMILGERNFLCLSDAGKVEFILKLDYVPKCFYSFVVGYYWEPNARLITAIISDQAKLFVYENSNIIWAAQYPFEAPIAVQRSNVNGLPGGIVTLCANGQLSIDYLGSDAYVFEVPPLNVNELSMSQAHKELLQLEEEIKEAVDIQDMAALTQRALDDVRLSFTIDSQINSDLDTLLLDVPADIAVKEFPSSSGTLKLRCKVDLTELQLTFNLPEGIRCSQDTITYTDIPAGMTEEFKLDFYIAELVHMHTARVDVICSFISGRGIPRVIQKSGFLPLSMFYKQQQPQKSGAIKVTYNIMTSEISAKLSTFFPEFVTWDTDVHALGLQLLCPGDTLVTEETVTIVVAKNSSRLRLQSEQLETLPMLMERIIAYTLNDEDATQQEHNKAKKRKQKGEMNRRTQRLMSAPVLPTSQILHKVDTHRETQENIRKQTEHLDELWLEFKNLQRKLQEKAEDEPKEALVMQIEQNYDKLIAEGDKLMDMRKDEKKQRCDLSCAMAVAHLSISTMRLEERIANVVLSVIVVPVEDWTELSWEESMSPGIDMLHHYGPLNKKTTAALLDAKTSATNSLDQFDYSRFRRHLALLFERVTQLASEAMNKPVENPIVADDAVSKNNEIGEMASVFLAQNAPYKSNALRKTTTLEAVEDDDEEAAEEEYDENDLRGMGYKRQYGNMGKTKAKSTEDGTERRDSSEWVNENFELPTADELFNDLGIWW